MFPSCHYCVIKCHPRVRYVIHVIRIGKTITVSLSGSTNETVDFHEQRPWSYQAENPDWQLACKILKFNKNKKTSKFAVEVDLETELRKPAGRLGEVSPCERGEFMEGVWGRGVFIRGQVQYSEKSNIYLCLM